MSAFGLPSLDAHAHIAPNVTNAQVRDLGNAHVFAMTRTLDEAESVGARRDTPLTWGLGVHPGRSDALDQFDPDRFDQLLKLFAVVGEVGLDKRGHLDVQKRVFEHVLHACANHAVVLSIHSAGRVQAVLDCLDSAPVPGPVLHWFLGTQAELSTAVTLGAYFSVNAAMPTSLLEAIPVDRILTETDFPARGMRAQRPGATGAVEETLAGVWQIPADDVRHRIWVNLKNLLLSTGAIDKVSDELADHALSV